MLSGYDPQALFRERSADDCLAHRECVKDFKLRATTILYGTDEHRGAVNPRPYIFRAGNYLCASVLRCPIQDPARRGHSGNIQPNAWMILFEDRPNLFAEEP